MNLQSIIAATVGTCVAIAAPHACGAYAITDLGTLGQPFAYAFAVDDSGRVAGTAARVDSQFHAYRWQSGLVDLGSLPGRRLSHATGMDAAGNVVGVSFNLGDRVPHAFKTGAGGMTDLGAFSARALNSAGDLAGWLTLPLTGGWQYDHACRYHAGGLTDLGTLGGSSSQALGMNDEGWIVGSSMLANDSTNRACLWIGASSFDLGTLGGEDSQAYDINASRQVVGVADTPAGLTHAFVYQLDAVGGVLSRTDLGAFGSAALGHSIAYAINDSGLIVGTSGSRAVLWSGGAMLDLNSEIAPGSGWKLASATAISPGGRIVGFGLHNDGLHAFLLSPPCVGDINADGIINGGDLSVLLSQFGTSVPAGTGADFNSDGVVNGADLSTFLSAFGNVC